MEIDPLLVSLLRTETVGDLANVEVHQADALELDLAALLGGDTWKVVANIPYYITTPLIERLLDARERLERIVLMVQREVAARLLAAPGTADYGSLSVFVQYLHRAGADRARLPGRFFLPPPVVDSAIIRLMVRREPAVRVRDEALFFRVVRASFQQRRKTLHNP